MRSQKSPIFNKLLPPCFRLYSLFCRLLYVLNEIYINKGQLYGSEIAFFLSTIKPVRVPERDINIQSHFRIDEFKYFATLLVLLEIPVRVGFSILLRQHCKDVPKILHDFYCFT